MCSVSVWGKGWGGNQAMVGRWYKDELMLYTEVDFVLVVMVVSVNIKETFKCLQ